MMADVLYRWPEAARFGRRVPKEKFYQHGKLSASVREKFVSELQRIRWSYKLAESTINLSRTTAVPEIQVFTLDSKAEDVSDSVLKAIDESIPFPIIFEVTRHTNDRPEIRTVATLKQLGSRTPDSSAYYSTAWLPQDTARKTLPVAIDLSSLYAALLQPLLPLRVRGNEQMSELAGRLASVRKLEREVASLERKLRAEPQFNRKVELRRTLKSRQYELADLIA